MQFVFLSVLVFAAIIVGNQISEFALKLIAFLASMGVGLSIFIALLQQINQEMALLGVLSGLVVGIALASGGITLLTSIIGSILGAGSLFIIGFFIDDQEVEEKGRSIKKGQ